MFNAFAARHAHAFAGITSVQEEEQKLEYTAAYNEFQQLFEAKLE
jgi:hypothetical protein